MSYTKNINFIQDCKYLNMENQNAYDMLNFCIFKKKNPQDFYNLVINNNCKNDENIINDNNQIYQNNFLSKDNIFDYYK
jgi:hypothetical protein